MQTSWATLRAHRSAVRSLSVSASGLHVLSGDDEGWVALWSLETRRPLAIWQAHTNACLTTQFWQRSATEGELLVTHARDNKLKIWKNPLVDEASRSQSYHTAPIPASESDPSPNYPKPWLVYTQDVNALNFCSVALANCQNMYAAPATTSTERIDVYTLDEHFAVDRPFKALNAADYLPLDTQLDDEAAVMSRRGLLGAVMALEFTESQHLLAGYESGHVALFDIINGTAKFVVQIGKSPILSITTFGQFAICSASDRKISTVHLNSGNTAVATQLVHRGVASVDVVVLAAGPYLVSAGWDGEVRLFQINIDSTLSINELESFKGGRQMGVTAAKIHAVHSSTSRRLRQLPPAWIVVAGKDGRLGLHALQLSGELV